MSTSAIFQVPGFSMVEFMKRNLHLKDGEGLFKGFGLFEEELFGNLYAGGLRRVDTEGEAHAFHEQIWERIESKSNWQPLLSTTTLNGDLAEAAYTKIRQCIVDEIGSKPKDEEPDEVDAGAVSVVIQEVIQEVIDARDAAAAIGCGADNSNGNPTAQDIQAILRQSRMMPVKKLLEILGRFKSAMAKKLRERSNTDLVDIATVEYGCRFPMVLRSEWTKPKPLIALAITQRRLAQLKIDAPRDRKLGPIIIGVDVSGSMTGGRWAYALGCALALSMIAKKQNRKAWFFSFDTGIYGPVEAFGSEFLKAASMFSGGGTYFDPPLRTATKLVGGVCPTADFVIITDGLSSTSKPVVDAWVATQGRLMVLNVGSPVDAQRVFHGAVWKYAQFSVRNIGDGLIEPTIDLLDEVADVDRANDPGHHR